MHYKPWSMNIKLFLSFSMADKYATCNKLYLVYEKNALKNHFFLFNVVTKQQHWGRFWAHNCHLL